MGCLCHLKLKSVAIRYKLSSRTRFIPINVIVNVQPHCNGHFCWRRDLASPAAEDYCYWDNLCSRFLVRELSYCRIFLLLLWLVQIEQLSLKIIVWLKFISLNQIGNCEYIFHCYDAHFNGFEFMRQFSKSKNQYLIFIVMGFPR